MRIKTRFDALAAIVITGPFLALYGLGSSAFSLTELVGIYAVVSIVIVVVSELRRGTEIDTVTRTISVRPYRWHSRTSVSFDSVRAISVATVRFAGSRVWID